MCSSYSVVAHCLEKAIDDRYPRVLADPTQNPVSHRNLGCINTHTLTVIYSLLSITNNATDTNLYGNVLYSRLEASTPPYTKNTTQPNNLSVSNPEY